jgi:RNA methyltransferase, TrmH family
MITSPDNDKLKTIRKLQSKRWRERLEQFAAEGEDLVAAAAAAGWEPELVLRAGEDVEAELLDGVSALGSGTRVIGVYRRRWSQPGGRLSLYLHGVGDPGNVGTAIRSAHALADGPVVLGPGCADPFAPKAVRASMGSLFARPPARAEVGELGGALLALDARGALTLAEAADALAGGRPAAGAGATPAEGPGTAVVERPGRVAAGSTPQDVSAGTAVARPGIVVCLGAEREGLPADVLERADAVARIPLRPGGPDSLNVAMAATVALYELANRMPADV